MSSFEDALKKKIAALDKEVSELENEILIKSAKLETLEELLAEEQGLSSDAPAPKKKRGRPKKKAAAKTKTKTRKPTAEEDALYAEALATLPEEGTTPELQERLTKRYRPLPRTGTSLGPGVHAGTLGDIKGRQNDSPHSDKSISVDDGDA